MKRIKVICALLLAVILLPVLTLKTHAETPLCGDVNGDGAVTYDDAAAILDYTAGTGTLELSEMKAADINGDGLVNVIDAAEIIHYLSGVLSVIPYEPHGYARLVILAYPEKTAYTAGEQLDLTGLRLAVAYENGAVTEVTDYTYSGYSETAGVKIIVLSYGDSMIAFTVTVYPE